MLDKSEPLNLFAQSSAVRQFSAIRQPWKAIVTDNLINFGLSALLDLGEDCHRKHKG